LESRRQRLDERGAIALATGRLRRRLREVRIGEQLREQRLLDVPLERDRAVAVEALRAAGVVLDVRVEREVRRTAVERDALGQNGDVRDPAQVQRDARRVFAEQQQIDGGDERRAAPAGRGVGRAKVGDDGRADPRASGRARRPRRA